ncbi:MAG TPA: hypothetical protein VE218_05190 [Acidobacteriaceae bacterium]|jgi:hypothetical protein|nr:hypothetical protein [Acidobacteriaceae bacterium]
MHPFIRKLSFGCAMLLPLAFALSPALNAQDDGPPNVLVIQREYLKPGKGGMLHERSESAFVRAFANAKSDSHYFALDSLSGPTRSLFVMGYNNFADWEKDRAATTNDKVLNAAVDHAAEMDGDLLSSYDSVAMRLRPDLSMNKGSINGTRYFEITTFVVKPGHRHDFDQLAHMYADAYKKIAPDTHWDCFEVMYGNPAPGFPSGATFVVINTMKSQAETDKGMADFEKFAKELGTSGMEKMEELTAASIETTGTNLFAINPRMSNPSQEWIDKEPAFWKVPPTSMTKETALKTANQ